MAEILLIMASVRPSRIADQLAEWVVAQNATDLAIEVIDLKDWYLPMDDEPHQPKQKGFDGYCNDHTREWSKKVDAADGFIFLFPQYNWGYPAALKNALDHLYEEWQNKPAILTSYGARGGGKASAQLAEVCQGLHLEPIATRPALPIKGAQKNADGRLCDPQSAFADYAETMSQALSELAAALQ